jgi:hypothetical protein
MRQDTGRPATRRVRADVAAPPQSKLSPAAFRQVAPRARLAVHDADGRCVGAPTAIRRGRAEQVRRQRNAQDNGRGDRGGQDKGRAAEPRPVAATLEDASSFQHGRIVRPTAMALQEASGAKTGAAPCHERAHQLRKPA